MPVLFWCLMSLTAIALIRVLWWGHCRNVRKRQKLADRARRMRRLRDWVACRSYNGPDSVHRRYTPWKGDRDE
jgi:hypothetical protein